MLYIAVADEKYSGQVRSASYKSRNQSNLLYTIAASFSIQKIALPRQCAGQPTPPSMRA